MNRKYFFIYFLVLAFIFQCAGIVAYSQDNENIDKVKEHYLRGNIFYQQGKYKEAQDEFKKALDLLGAQPESLAEKGIQAKQIKEKETLAQPKPKEAKPSTEYIIGEEDVLYISVWQNPDLDQEVIVRPDGRISFPLIGDVQASGLSVTELDHKITEALKEYVKYPEVSISIRKLGGKKVMVLGEVNRPGVYAVTGAKTVLEAISQAGGFTKDAVSSSVVIISGGFQNPQARRVNLARALAGDMRQNISLQSEDVVFVPKKFIANLNYFLSQIIDPLSKGVYTATQLQAW